MRKKSVTKTKITDMLSKEQMSVYDVGKFLKQTGEFFQDMDLSPMRILDKATTDTEKIVDTIKRAVQRIVNMQDELNEARVARAR